jgi:hypothetical protein
MAQVTTGLSLPPLWAADSSRANTEVQVRPCSCWARIVHVPSCVHRALLVRSKLTSRTNARGETGHRPRDHGVVKAVLHEIFSCF